MSGKDQVDHRIPASDEMLRASELPRALTGGTQGMRDKGKKYLPVYELEQAQDWRTRLDQTFLYNGYKRAWQSLVGKVFDEPLVLPEDAPVPITDLVQDIDLTGQHLDVFAQWVFADSLHSGGGHILVDHPEASAEMTAADERAMGIRPYWVYIPAESVLGWRTDRIGGVETLTHFRYKEVTCEQDGLYGTQEIERVRVFDRDDSGRITWQKWELREKTDGRSSEWMLVEEGTLDGVSAIPLATFYARRWAYMEFRPALEDLAWTNLEHWQSSSAQRASLHFDRVAWYHFRGFTENELKSVQGIGAGVRTAAKDPGSGVDVIERANSGTTIGERDLEALERKMQWLGLEPRIERPGNETATARAIDEAAAQSTLGSWVRNFTDCLDVAFAFTAEWMGIEWPGGVQISSDFGLKFTAVDEIELLSKLRLSDATVWEAAKERGLLPDEWTVEDERERLQQQGPAMSSGGGGLLRRRLAQRMAEEQDTSATTSGEPVEFLTS